MDVPCVYSGGRARGVCVCVRERGERGEMAFHTCKPRGTQAGDLWELHSEVHTILPKCEREEAELKSLRNRKPSTEKRQRELCYSVAP